MHSNIQIKTDTQLYDALQLVVEEQKHITNALISYDQFSSGVCEIDINSPVSTARSGNTTPQSLDPVVRNKKVKDDRIQRVQELFAETIAPYSTEDVDRSEPLSVTICEEFGEGIALALSTSTNSRFTSNLKQAILLATAQSQAELQVMKRGLEIEEESLRESISDCEMIADWLSTDQPLTQIADFDELNRRRKALSDHLQRCEQLAVERQSTIHSTTKNDVSNGLSHGLLVEYLYQPLSTEYPVLSAVVQLNKQCLNQKKSIDGFNID